MSIVGGQPKKHAFNPKQQKTWNALFLSLIITSLFTVVFHWTIIHLFESSYLKDYPTLKTKAVPYPLMFALQTGEEVLNRDERKKKKNKTKQNIRYSSCKSSALNLPFNTMFGIQLFAPISTETKIIIFGHKP